MSRFVDEGAIFGGWVGLGSALVLAIAFELIIPVQTLVFLLAPLMGLVVGVYANVKSDRWRPRRRALANAGYAGLVSGVGLAGLYVVVRLIFIYGDTGSMPDGTRLDCQTGPDCIYERYVTAGQADELASLGIADGQTLEAAAWRELLVTGAGLVLLTVGGALVGGLARSFQTPPRSEPLLPGGGRLRPGTDKAPG